MQEANIAVKGSTDGLLIILNETEEWLRITAELAEHLDKNTSFFEGADVTVDTGNRPVPKYDLTSLIALLERRGLKLVTVLSESDTTLESAHLLDIQTNPQEDYVEGDDEISENDADTVKIDVVYTDELTLTPEPSLDDTVRIEFDESELEEQQIETDSEEYGTEGILIRRTLRSGRTAHSQGHIVIYGDVNAGAKVIAAGDVIIWGRLRGMVHAGSEGDETAIICALEMNPSQLRIADQIATSPSDNKKKRKKKTLQPEIAFIRDDQIIVENWN